MDIHYQDYIISDDKEKIQPDRVQALLKTSYWAKDRTKETIEKSIANSLCFGVFKDGIQIGFARCVTDYATAYWLCDVIVDSEYRKLGLGKALMDMVVHSEHLRGCSGILGTSNAHGLYERYGFKVSNGNMMRRKPDA